MAFSDSFVWALCKVIAKSYDKKHSSCRCACNGVVATAVISDCTHLMCKRQGMTFNYSDTSFIYHFQKNKNNKDFLRVPYLKSEWHLDSFEDVIQVKSQATCSHLLKTVCTAGLKYASDAHIVTAHYSIKYTNLCVGKGRGFWAYILLMQSAYQAIIICKGVPWKYATYY